MLVLTAKMAPGSGRWRERVLSYRIG